MIDLKQGIFILIVVVWIFEVKSIVPGIYVDTGNRTLLEYQLTESEISDLQDQLAYRLGFPQNLTRINKDEIDYKNPALKFLWEIYDEFSEDAEDDDDDADDGGNNALPKREKRSDLEIPLSEKEENLIKSSDVIMTFMLKRNSAQYKSLSKRGFVLLFDTSKIMDYHSLMLAKLRCYKSMSNLINEQILTISVFFISSDDNYKNMHTQLLQSREVSSLFSGWLHFDVSNAISLWKNDTKSNKGLLIKIQVDDKILSVMEAEKLGIFQNIKDKEPFLVGYFQRGKVPNQPIPSGKMKNRRKRQAEPTTKWINPLFQIPEECKSCHMKTIYVNFLSLGYMFENVLAPTGALMNFCTGKCIFPMTAHLNATNHAIVQSLVHLMQPELRVPQSRCAPRKYINGQILYMNEGGPDMVQFQHFNAKQCGCH